MKHMHTALVASISSLLPAFAAAFTLANGLGCESDSSLGTAGAADKYQVHPLDLTTVGLPRSGSNDVGRGQIHLLLNARDGGAELTQFILTSQHLYFTAAAEGLYRIPKHGGVVDVIDAGKGTKFGSLDTLDEDVYWTRTRFDDRHFPSVEFKRRAAPNGAISVVFSGDWGIAQANSEPNFEVTRAGIYFLGSQAGGPMSPDLLFVPANGDRPVPVLSSPTFWPTWRRDHDRMFFAALSLGSPETVVSVLVDGETAPQALATVPIATARIEGMDADFLYFSDGASIWQVGKADGTTTRLFEDHFLGPILVDGQQVIYTARTESEPVLRSFSKADGATRTLASGGRLLGISQIEQDDELVYLLHTSGVSVVAKN